MLELKLGEMKSKEIADWMGISYITYRKSKKEKLEKLKEFADFEETYGGVNITKIKCAVFVKNFKDVFVYLEEVIKSENEITTISGITRKILEEGKPPYEGLAFDTVKRRMSKGGLVGFGKFGESQGGIFGTRKRSWVVKLDDFNSYRVMTREEYLVFLAFIKRYYGENTEEIIAQLALLTSAEYGYMTEEEVERERDKITNFKDLLKKYRDYTGLQLVCGTIHERCAWHNYDNIPEKFLPKNSSVKEM